MSPSIIPTNKDRAAWAKAALDAYAEQTRNDPNDRDYAELLRDLLGDLMHYADEQGFDFDDELEMSRTHYDYERDDEA